MTKYCIIFESTVLTALCRTHKKSNTNAWSYPGINAPYYNVTVCDILFDSSLSAKVWLLLHSSFPKVSERIHDLINDETKIDLLIKKGKYTVKYSSFKFLIEALRKKNMYTYPYLCEFQIMEYDEITGKIK